MNFIRQILQRSLAPAASTVQPRLASRFESSPAPARFSEEKSEGAGATSSAPVTSRPTSSPTLPPLVSIAETFSPPAPALSASPLTSAPITTSAASVPFSSIKPVASEPSPIRPAPTVALAASPAPISTPAIARDFFSPPPVAASTLLVERVTERIREISPAIAPQTPAPSAAFSAISTSVSAPVARPTLVASLAPVVPAVSVQPTATGSEPATIHVSIGRVDIRAITAPPVAPVRPPRSERRPLVSLESYLSQRNSS